MTRTQGIGQDEELKGPKFGVQTRMEPVHYWWKMDMTQINTDGLERR